MHAFTPALTAYDPRGLAVRTVEYYRAQAEAVAQPRVTQQQYDLRAWLVGQRDPRLFALSELDDEVPHTLNQRLSLSGATLLSESVDAGWRLALRGVSGHSMEHWDGRLTHSRFAYDSSLRPTEVTYRDASSVQRVSERFTYAVMSDDAASRNQAGQLIRHDDMAGSRWHHGYSLSGEVLCQEQRFLRTLEMPDWPEPESQRNELLEAAPGFITVKRFDATGTCSNELDAHGNSRGYSSTVDGVLHRVRLLLAEGVEQTLVSEISYGAWGQVTREVAGNGVVTSHAYEESTGLLTSVKAVRDDAAVLQSLVYEHDPKGNIVLLRDDAPPARRQRNQMIDTANIYEYDTLGQLIKARGREVVTPNHGPDLPPFQSPIDASLQANYTQAYDYDAAGNLTRCVHVGAQNHTLEMTVARFSNRSLPRTPTESGDEAIAAGFDANGNLLNLERSRSLSWNPRNELASVTWLSRIDALDDAERYAYDGAGQRLRKITCTQARNVAHQAEVRYLPGLEMRTDTATGEALQVIRVKAGISDVRVLHWVRGRPADVSNDQVRYTLGDHLGSCELELDQQASLISRESYYPFGGTSGWAGRNAVEASYKTARYSGKERDATGLYYYGFRYYAPWVCRWINPDPAGVGSRNRYSMVNNSPVSHFDSDGLVEVEYQGRGDRFEKKSESRGETIVARGRAQVDERSRSPEALGQALELSATIIKGALIEFEATEPSRDLKQMVSMTLGSKSVSRLQELKDLYSAMSQIVEAYQGGDKSNQIALVIGSKGNAYVTPNDPHQRLFLSEEQLTKHPLSTAMVLIHEFSHLSAVGRTKDFAYLNPTLNKEVSESIDKKQFDAHLGDLVKVSGEMVAGKYKNYMFARVLEVARSGGTNEEELMSVFEVNSGADIRVERLGQVSVRSNLLFKNADSIAALAIFLSHSQIKSQLRSWGKYHSS